MIIKSFVLIEHNERYLLIQEASEKHRGKWYLPGGRAKRNEDPAAAVERETWEEAGVKVKLTGIFFIKCYPGIFSSRINIYYTGASDGTKLKTYEDKHSMRARWCRYEDLAGMPLRQKLVRLIDRYRRHRKVIPVKHFKLAVYKSALKKLI